MNVERSHERVGDYVDLIRGKTYRGSLVGVPGPALLGLGSIAPGGGFRIDNYRTYGGECPTELMLVSDEIYVALKGATKDGKMIGSVARVPPSISSGRLTQDTVKLVFKNSSCESRSYMYWLLRTSHYRSYCQGHAMGSAVVALSRRDFLSYPVPPLTEKRKTIVRLLDRIEEKVDVLRQMNAPLEAMARAIFRDWFIEFGPTRAKMESGPPYLAPDIWALFPNRRDEGGKPEGWVNSNLSRIADLVKTTITPSQHSDEIFAHYSLPAFDAGQRPVTEIGRGILSNKIIVPPGAVLLSKLNPEIARVWLTDVEPTARAIASTEFLVLQPSSSDLRSFIYCCTSEIGFRRQLEGLVSGTSKSHQRVNPSAVVNLSLVLAPSDIMLAFNRLVEPMLRRILSNRQEAISLTVMRDFLLPKLILDETHLQRAETLLVTAA